MTTGGASSTEPLNDAQLLEKCSREPALCHCVDPTELEPLELLPSCDAAGLVVESVYQCKMCSEPMMAVVLGNVGRRAAASL